MTCSGQPRSAQKTIPILPQFISNRLIQVGHALDSVWLQKSWAMQVHLKFSCVVFNSAKTLYPALLCGSVALSCALTMRKLEDVPVPTTPSALQQQKRAQTFQAAPHTTHVVWNPSSMENIGNLWEWFSIFSGPHCGGRGHYVLTW